MVYHFSAAAPGFGLGAVLVLCLVSSSLAQTLGRDAKLTASLEPGTTHLYEINLAAGDFLHVRAEQGLVDLTVRLFPPNEEPIVVDSPNGTRDAERLWIVAESKGIYHLEISGTQEVSAPAISTAPGGYRLVLDGPRHPEPIDELRATAFASYALGERLRVTGSPAKLVEARKAYQQGLTIWSAVLQDVDDLYLIAFAEERLGDLAKIDLAWPEAMQHYQRALEIVQKLGDRRQQVGRLNKLGLVLCELEDLAKAQQHFSESLKIAREFADQVGEATALNNLGLLHYLRGETHLAIDLYHQALTLWSALERPTEQAQTYTNVATTYRLLGDLEAALRELETGRKLLQESKDSKAKGILLSEIGYIYMLRGLEDLARSHFERVLELGSKTGDRSLLAGTWDRLGTLYMRSEDYSQAERAFRQAISLAEELDDRRDQAHSLNNLAALELARRRPTAALDNANQALKLFDLVFDPHGRGTAYYCIARAYDQIGQPELALGFLKQALDLLEYLRVAAGDPSKRMAIFSTRHEYYEFYIDLLMDLHEHMPEAHFAQMALEAAEMARARSLLEEMSRRYRSPTSVSPALEARLHELGQDLKQIIQRSSAQITSSPATAIEDSGKASKWRQMLLAYETLRAQVNGTEEVKQPLGWQQMQALLDTQTVFLIYALGEKRSFAWLLSQEGMIVSVLAPRSTIERLSRHFYRSVRETSELAIQERPAAGRELADAILAPVAPALQRLAPKRLVVLPDGLLSQIPFAALPLPLSSTTSNDTSPALLEHFEVVYLPSISSLAVIRQRNRPRAPKIAAIFFDPVFERSDSRIKEQDTAGKLQTSDAEPTGLGPYSLGRLTSSHIEAAAIRRWVSKPMRLLVEGFDARPEVVTHGDLGLYRIIHFATHGLLHDEPQFSGLVFSLFDDNGEALKGFLPAFEIYNLDLAAELVVLSACSTGLGRQVPGEGVLSLTRSFQAAGADRVVVSLWQVSDHLTAQLMERFYESLFGQNLSPAAALRQAQLEIRRQDPEPYAWAPFILQGEWRSLK